jgi:ABC-type sugar transport system substrate-binding protein
MKKRLLLSVVALAMMALIATSAFATGAEDDGQLDITFVTPLIAHPVWDVARAGFEDAAADMGFRSQYVGPQGIDPAEMVNQIEIAIAQGVDGIIAMPIAPTAMRPAFKKAAEAGIPVVFIGAVDPEAPSLASVGTDEANIGRIGAEAIMEYYAERGNPPLRAVVMQSTMDASFAIKARDSYVAYLEENYPDFEMVINESCNSDMMIAMQKYESVFKAYPEINLVIGVCGEAGPAAAKVLKEQNLLDEITVVAIDDVDETLDLIEDGSIWGTVAQNFYKMAYLSSEILVDFIVDGKEPQGAAGDGYGFDSGAMFVTVDNIDSSKEILMK